MLNLSINEENASYNSSERTFCVLWIVGRGDGAVGTCMPLRWDYKFGTTVLENNLAISRNDLWTSNSTPRHCLGETFAHVPGYSLKGS